MLYWSALIIALSIFLSTNNRYKWFYILYKTYRRDVSAAIRFSKLNWKISKWMKNRDTVPKIFSELAKKHPQKVVFYYGDESWTFEKLELFSNQVAHHFKSRNYEKGDCVALLLENRPEYVGIWLGLSKIGVVTALINTNLTSDPLVHSLKTAPCKAVIYGTDFAKVVSDVSGQITDLEQYEFDDKFLETIANQPKTLPADVTRIEPNDKILYIYTSGTTGLPKAAIVSNIRYMYAAVGAYCLTNLSPDDIYYNPLPLYHTAGGMVAVGQGVVFGLSVALRKKFSASSYWSDCVKYKCTVSNYIGEICRYLLAAHKAGVKVEHPVRRVIGNGLRPQIWKEFVETFHIEYVHEFYGSTEGNSNLINIDNKVGAVGFVPRYADFIYPVTLIRCNENTGEPIRYQNGLCRRCAPNVPGILVGEIDQKKAQSQFGGYVDQGATKKKLLRDVFRKGDVFFNTGDVLVQDELGYFYFRDRTGDTFRWKGENVSTSEVEAVLSNVAEFKDTVVYGVQIPGTEGRAGMATIVDPDNSLDLVKLVRGLKSQLPGYAVPVFLRITDSLPVSGTFKLKKIDLQKEGFDFDAIKDHRLYFYDAKSSEYVAMTKEIYDDINSGRIRL